MSWKSSQSFGLRLLRGDVFAVLTNLAGERKHLDSNSAKGI